MTKDSMLRTTALMGALSLLACGPAASSEDDSSSGVTGDPTTGLDTDETGTEETTTTTTTTTDDETGDETASFVQEEGGGDECGTQCDIWNPDDCMEGEKCTAAVCEVGGTGWDSNVCRPIEGSASAGDECMYGDAGSGSGYDTCDAGAMCWNADADTGIGTCIAFCTGSAGTPSCEAGSTCVIVNDGVLPICLAGCDPLSQDCEGNNEICIPTQDTYVCALDVSGDMAPYGTPCNAANVCNGGLICIDAAGVPEADCAAAGSCCSPMCSIAEAAPCPGEGQTCEPVFDMQPPGYEDVGVCTIAG